MTDQRAFFPARARLLVGAILLIAAPALAWGKWNASTQPLETLAWFEQHRSPGDSLAYASAVYHGSFARAAHRTRWRPTGYATLGVTGTLIGIALIVSSRRRTAG